MRRRTRVSAAPIPLSALRAAVVGCIAVALSGCSAAAPDAALLSVASAPEELMPHGDGDRFVYVFERTKGDEPPDRGVQVETVATTAVPGEFEVTLTEDGRVVGRTRYRDDGHAIVELSEEAPDEGLQITFTPPLPVFALPLTFTPRTTTGVAIVRRLSDGLHQGTLKAEGTLRVAPTVAHSRVGDFEHAVALHLERRLEGTNAASEMHAALVVAPRVGEVHSEGGASDGPSLNRDLVCATIAGHTIGDCSKLPSIVNPTQ